MDIRPPASRLLPWRLLFFFFFFAGNTLCTADTDADAKDFIEWSGGGLLKDGETLVSAGGRFELGFLALGSSGRKFLCVRFRKGEEKPVVWVANRERPLVNTSAGVLKFGGDGNLVVAAGDAAVVWSTRLPAAASGNRVARILDSGNLVVREGAGGGGGSSPGEVLWQSFDEPGDTLLAGMKMVVNTRTNTSRRLTCWKSADDPSPGNVTYGLEINILPRLVLREGSRIILSVGIWNGVRFSGFQSMNRNDMFNSSVVSSGDETYYSDSMIGDAMLLRVVVLPRGEIQRFVWKETTGASTWTRLWTAPMKCERFGVCGPYGTCMEDLFPPCQCLKGFVARSPSDWSMGNGAGGCVRSSKLGCGGDLFLPVLGAKLPEMTNSSSLSAEISLEECRQKCAKDCSCVAYAGADAKQGKGCITWSGDLVDIRNLSNNLQEFYLRLAASEFVVTTDDPQGKGSSRREVAVIVAAVCVSSVVATLLLCGFIFKSKHGKAKKLMGDKSMIEGEDMEIPLFDFGMITSVTNNFSAHNRIGEGGFGTVYKAVLEGGQEVAVKRLAWNSAQGVREFMNEVKLIVKLQHNNLVRLQGCCIHGHERILIFEYMHNGSLDTFIFDDEPKRRTLDWRMRLDIILGIARGLLYLHHDSRLKIVHRDLKAGNILLDDAMNPKISDFGTARIFSSDQHSESTIRVIGTYGYMAPEYALNGVISVKSDVFSFGVLVLEVLSGIRSRGIYEADQSHRNLLSYAWELWRTGNCWELLDPKVAGGPFNGEELLRCMQVGLLCVQENAGDRPTMRQVVKMLDSELVSSLPEPRRPGFLVLRSAGCTEAPSASVSNRMTTATCLREGR